MRGFQLWINLPAREKLKPAGYRDIPAGELPVLERDGAMLKLLAGSLELDGESLHGPINSQPGAMATDPLFVDIDLQAGAGIELPVPPGHNAFVYAYEGDLTVDGQPLATQAAGILGDGDRVQLKAGESGARVILLAGKPLGEPVVQYGPFVMNTREEIEQALADYRAGNLTG